jgi:hypothetical protein
MSTMVADDMALMTNGAAIPTMVVGAVSMSMVDEAMLMSMDGAESTVVADVEPSNLVGVARLAMVGEGAGESVDLDPVVPTVGTN